MEGEALIIPGTITAFLNGVKVSSWGGKDAWLSNENEENKGLCLCVKKGKFVRKFELRAPLKVTDNPAKKGLLAVQCHFNNQTPEIHINAPDALDELDRLKDICNVIQQEYLESTREKKGPGTVRSQQPSSKGNRYDVKRRFFEGKFGTVEVRKGARGEGQGLVNKKEPSKTIYSFKSAELKRKIDQEEQRRMTEAASVDLTQLTPQQRRVVNWILGGTSVLVTGCGGTGKSFLLRELVKMSDKKTTFCTASTGVASLEIGGVTLHSFAGVGLGTGTKEQWLERVEQNDRAKSNWRRCRKLFIDEISMVDGDTLDKLNFVAQNIRKNVGEVFGGIQLILFGDFLQLPPVTENDRDRKFAFEATVWKDLRLSVMELTGVFRQVNEDFIRVLSEVRRGELSDRARILLRECVGRTLDVSDGIIPTKLYSLNKDVETENFTQLDKLPGASVVFKARDEGREPFLRGLQQSSPLVDRLELRLNAQVMLLRNMTASNLRNGSRGVVIRFDEGLPVVRFSSGREVLVTYFDMVMDIQGEIVATRTQIPLRLAWAITVHKSQGTELDKVEISLDKSVFEYGQAYTALSRARSLDGLRLLGFEENCIRAHPAVVSFMKANNMWDSKLSSATPIKDLPQAEQDRLLNMALKPPKAKKAVAEEDDFGELDDDDGNASSIVDFSAPSLAPAPQIVQAADREGEEEEMFAAKEDTGAVFPDNDDVASSESSIRPRRLVDEFDEEPPVAPRVQPKPSPKLPADQISKTRSHSRPDGDSDEEEEEEDEEEEEEEEEEELPKKKKTRPVEEESEEEDDSDVVDLDNLTEDEFGGESDDDSSSSTAKNSLKRPREPLEEEAPSQPPKKTKQ